MARNLRLGVWNVRDFGLELQHRTERLRRKARFVMDFAVAAELDVLFLLEVGLGPPFYLAGQDVPAPYDSSLEPRSVTHDRRTFSMWTSPFTPNGSSAAGRRERYLGLVRQLENNSLICTAPKVLKTDPQGDAYRGVGCSWINFGGGRLLVGYLHAPSPRTLLSERERILETAAAKIQDEADGHPFVLCGDLNFKKSNQSDLQAVLSEFKLAPIVPPVGALTSLRKPHTILSSSDHASAFSQPYDQVWELGADPLPATGSWDPFSAVPGPLRYLGREYEAERRPDQARLETFFGTNLLDTRRSLNTGGLYDFLERVEEDVRAEHDRETYAGSTRKPGNKHRGFDELREDIEDAAGDPSPLLSFVRWMSDAEMSLRAFLRIDRELHHLLATRALFYCSDRRLIQLAAYSSWISDHVPVVFEWNPTADPRAT